MVNRFKGSGREQEGGYLATHKQDFNSHHSGADWRHGAPDIDMEPIIPSIGGPTVQETLENIANIIQSNGSGFISIGSVETDGYAGGSYNVGATGTPTFYDAFNAAKNDDRLANGGVILILAGTYRVTNTIQVPPGITVMGELAGSIIIGEVSELPMFKILQGSNKPKIGGDSGSGAIDLGISSPLETKFVNLILADNLDGYITSGGQPIATMQTVPMIFCEKASNFICENVRFIGRVNNGTVAGRGKTKQAVGGYTSGGSTSTSLTLHKCFFDGMKTAAAFKPGNGDIDHLTVDKCRARTFGTETAGTLEDNCFVSMSLCNATLTNNYHVGYGTYPTQIVLSLFIVSTLGSGGSDVDVVVSGNSGGPSGSVTKAKSVYYGGSAAAGATALKAVVSGNTWGTSAQNPWFITVGDGNTIVDGTTGDFVGSGAIDLILSGDLEYAGTTIVINPGTYTVTSTVSSNLARYNLVGNKDGSNYPTIEIAATTGSGPQGLNALPVGSHVEGIKFKSGVSTAHKELRPQFSTIASNEGIRNIFVKDCVFQDVALSIDEISFISTEPDSGPVTTGIVVSNCHFTTTITYATSGTEYIKCLLPSAENVTVENCVFEDRSYALAIGEYSTYTHSSSLQDPIFTVRDCVFDMTGGDIESTDFIAPSQSAYIRIQDVTAKIYFNNCNVYRQRTLGGTLTVTDMPGFVRLVGHEVYVKDCILAGPDDLHTVSATNYGIAALRIQSEEDICVSGNRFLGCSVGLQVTAAGTSGNGMFGDRRGVSVYNNHFNQDSLTQFGAFVDIDFDLTSSTNPPHINIYDNYMEHTTSTNGTRVWHENADYAAVVGNGGVIVYANHCTVDIHHNKIICALLPVSGAPTTPFDYISAVLINNVDSTTGTGGALLPVTISNNNITALNSYVTTTAADVSACLWVKTTGLNINNNIMFMNSATALSTSQVVCAFADIREVSALWASATINNNIFRRINADGGTATSLQGGYVRISGSCEAAGSCIDNIFDSTTTDGSTETVFDDQSSLWYSSRNINEIYTVFLRGGQGNYGLIDNVATVTNVSAAGTGASALQSQVKFDPLGTTTGTPAFTFLYATADAGTRVIGLWDIPFSSFLPAGATLYSVDVDVDISVQPDTFRTSTLQVTSSSGTDTDTTATLTIAGHSHSLGPSFSSGPHRNLLNGNSPGHIHLLAAINDSTVGALYTAGQMTIKYRF